MGKSSHSWKSYQSGPRGRDWFDVRDRRQPTPETVTDFPAAHGPLRPIDERCYLVEARLGWRHFGAVTLPEATLFYAAPGGERVHDRTVDAVCDDGEWEIADYETVHASAVFALGGGDSPTGACGRSADKVAEEYRAVLADVHGVEDGGRDE